MQLSQRHRIVVQVVLPLLFGYLITIALQLRTSSYLREYHNVLTRDIDEKLVVREMEIAFGRQIQQWQNILLRGRDAEDFDHYRAAFFAEEAHVRLHLRELENVEGRELRRAMLEFRDFHTRLGVKYRKALTQLEQTADRTPFAIDESVRGIDQPSAAMAERIAATIDAKIVQRNLELERHIELERTVAWALTTLLFGIAALGLLRVFRGLRQQEEQLHKKRHLDALGRVSGGIAHHFNNLLMVIGGYSDMLEKEHSPQSEAGEAVRAIKQSSSRCAALVKQLLAYTSRRPMQKSRIDANVWLRQLQPRLAELTTAAVHVNWDLAADAGIVFVDAEDLQEAFLNLIRNALDAMPEGGTLTLQTRRTMVERPTAMTSDRSPEEDCLVVSVTDTGIGMDEEVLEHAFEPFFTTKGSQRGGLGLSMCLGFARQCGGDATAQSVYGEGTTVSIILPQKREQGVNPQAPA